jgi:hypothetical protein
MYTEMKTLIARELRCLAIMALVAVVILLSAIVLMRIQFDLWQLNLMSATVRPHLLLGLLGLWTIVAVEHINGRESSKANRRSLALLPLSLNRIFTAKLIATLGAIALMAGFAFGVEAVARELFPFSSLDRITSVISWQEYTTFVSLMGATVLFFSIVIKGSGGTLAVSSLFLERWEAPKSSASTLLAIARLTVAAALLVGSWCAHNRGQLHRGQKMRPLMVSIPAVFLMLCPSIAWGSLAFSELVDLSFDREDVHLRVGELFETNSGIRVVIYAKRDDHKQISRSLLFDPTRRELFELGLAQYPTALNHRKDGIIVYDCTNSLADGEAYAIDGSGQRIDMPTDNLISSRDFKLHPQPINGEERCHIAYDGSKRKLIVERRGERIRTMPAPPMAPYVFENKIWSTEIIDLKIFPWQKKLICVDPFDGSHTEFKIPDLLKHEPTKTSNMRPTAIVGPGLVLAAGNEGQLVLFDVVNDTQEMIIEAEGEGALAALVSTWNGEYVVVQRYKKSDQRLGILHVQSRRLEYLPEDDNLFVHPNIGVIGLSPDGRFVVGGWKEPFVINLAQGVSSRRRLPYRYQGLRPAWIGPHTFLVGEGKKIISVNVETIATTTLLDVSK